MRNELFLYGVIGDQAAGLDAKTFTAAIRAATGDLDVYINSAGGFVFEGLPIYEALAAYDRGTVTVHIDGLAASMASAVAMAGDQIIMAETALIMVHKPWDSTNGNADEMRRYADQLDKIEAQLVGIYAKRTGLPAAKIAAMLSAETWLDAGEALALGFITSTSASLKAAAMADVSACGFRNLPPRLKGTTMDHDTIAPMNATEITEVRGLVNAHGLPESVATEIFRKKMTVPQARAHILDVLATAGDALQVGHSPRIMFGNPSHQANAETLDNPAFHAKAVTDVLYSRLSGKAPQGAARELMNTSLVDLAREMIAQRGVRNAYRLRPNEVLDQATWGGARASSARNPWLTSSQNAFIPHTAGDFPNLLLDASQRYLLDQYQGAESILKTVAKQRTAKDFRALSGVQLSGFGSLPSLGDGAEFKSGTFSERKESYAVSTFGKMFGISRTAIVNDDLGAFADMFKIMGRAAAETEALTLVGLLNANANMSDGNALFSVAHNNYKTPGAVPSVATLDLMRQAMRGQKDADGVTYLNVPTKYLVVPSALETTAQVITGSVLATTLADANPFTNMLIPLVEPRLTSTTAWYGFADPAQSAVLEYAHLDGNNGPQTEMREGWSSLGQEFRVWLDFGCGVTGYAGGYKNAGA